MMSHRARVPRPGRPTLVLLASLAGPSCLRPNPAFDPDAEGGPGTVADPGSTNGTGGSIATDSADASGMVTTGSTSTTQPDGSTFAGEASTGGQPTGGVSSGDASSGDASSGDASSGDVVPGIYDIPATIGTCVFAAVAENPLHGGPDECSGDADAINDTRLGGLMMVDVFVDDVPGGNRPAVPYMRFDLPKELVGLTVVHVTLHVQVADGVTNLPQSGELWLSAPFSEDSLKAEDPTLVEYIAADKGEVQPDEWLSWQLDPGLVVLGEPLHLALKPTHNKGVILRGASTAAGAPYLTLEVE